jgi:hypothetical protein
MRGSVSPLQACHAVDFPSIPAKEPKSGPLTVKVGPQKARTLPKAFACPCARCSLAGNVVPPPISPKHPASGESSSQAGMKRAHR